MMSIRRWTASSRKQSVARLICLAAITASTMPVYAQGLTFDSGHDVVVLPESEVALRYNNKTFAPVKSANLDTTAGKGHFLNYPALRTVQVTEDFTGMSIGQTPETILIETYDSGDIGMLGMNRFNPDFLKNNRLREVTYSSQTVAKESGIPLGSIVACKAVKCYEAKPKVGGESYNVFALQHDHFLTFFARRMRSGRSDLTMDPPVIVLDMIFGPTAETKANVELASAPAPAASSETGAEKKN